MSSVLVKIRSIYYEKQWESKLDDFCVNLGKFFGIFEDMKVIRNLKLSKTLLKIILKYFHKGEIIQILIFPDFTPRTSLY